MEVNASDVCFNLSGTAYAHSVPVGEENREFRVEALLEYADGQTEYQHKEFNYCSTGEQQASVNVKPKRPGVKVRRIAACLVYRNNANLCYFYNGMLSMDRTGTSYTYDGKGNLISATDNASRNQAYTYNSADEVTKTTEPNNESYGYTYTPGKEHQVSSARSNQLGNGFVYSYDDKGNLTWTRMGTVTETGALDTASRSSGRRRATTARGTT